MDLVSAGDVLAFLEDRALQCRVNGLTPLRAQAPIAPGSPSCLSFASRRDEATRDAVRRTQSSLLIVLPEYAESVPNEVDFIAVADPRREFARVVGRFFIEERQRAVHPTAVIGAAVDVGTQPSIAAGAVVEDGCSLGDRVRIGANAVLCAGTIVGDDVVIGPGTVIGHTGFGYVREEDGHPLLVPHQGGVVIGDRVEIGANATIDRGTMDDTVIEEDAKIDNLVHIAHNCVIGRGAFVIATAILCGGVRVGPGAWISPNAAVREQLTVGEGATVGLSATVIKDVPDGATVVGSPAREL